MFKFSWIFIFALTVFTSACNKEETTNSDDLATYVDEVVFRMEESGNLGRFGCFELVFPISFEFPDESIVSVNDYDELRTAIQDWKEANPDATEKPSLVFPIEVLSEEGEVISVADKDELRALKRECGRNWFGNRGFRGHGGRCGSCFDLQFPITLAFPDGSTADATDRSEMKTLIRDWKEANPDTEERPELVFPITVELEEDGSIVTVNSAEELAALRESCAGN